MADDATPEKGRAIRTLNRPYQEMLDKETRPIAPCYRRDSPMEPGPTYVPVEVYVDRRYHELEKEKIWMRVWQVACHEDDIPNVGDYMPYEICDKSFLVVRTKTDEIKAYYNACLHRGRKLRENPGKGAKDLRCQFHAWTWSLDGRLTQVPCLWDFPDLKREEQSLPEAKVGIWGRFVFINPDPDCGPLEDFLGDLPSNFELLPYERRYKEAHVAKIIRCNWKLASEAFSESYHVIATHPQILLGGADDVDTKYDVFGNYSRAIRCGALEGSALPEWDDLPADGSRRVRHPLNGWVYEGQDDGLVRVTTPQGKSGLYTYHGVPVESDLGDVSTHLCDWVGGPQIANLPMGVAPASARKPGDTRHPRSIMADLQREALRKVIPSIADQIADIEFSSVFLTLFPNFHPWGSFNRIVYRFRPNGENHEECIMECMYLAPIPENGERPPTPPIHYLGADEPWTNAPELGMLAKVFEQDSRNLPQVQSGLHATAKKVVQLADYNETKPRHFHKIYQEWLQRT